MAPQQEGGRVTCNLDFNDISVDADPVSFWHETMPCARKPHTCFECKHLIAAGSQYWRVAYKFEGKLGCDCVCLACKEAMDEFEYRIFGGSFWNEMQESWSSGLNVQACINCLTSVEAKVRMHEQWMKWKGLR